MATNQSPSANPPKTLPATPFVTLSEALSWLAFRDARDQKSLNSELAASRPFRLGLDAAKVQLADAVESLTQEATGGRVEMRGKFWTNAHPAPATAVIDPVRFHDFRRYDITNDGLRFGSGLAWLPDATGSYTYAPIKREEFFSEVQVNRSHLFRLSRKGTTTSLGGDKNLRPLPEAKLKKWWSSLTPVERGKSQDMLRAKCAAKFPAHRVARQRIRAITPGRKRGRKPISQKEPA